MYKDYGWNEGSTDAHKYLYPALRKMLGPYKDSRILDIGCGNGAIACRLIDDGFNVYGLDASQTGISIASKKHPGKFFVQNVEEKVLPKELLNKNFNVVISTEVIEHLYDPRAYVDMVKSCLSRDGVFIVSTPYHGYLKNCALALTNKLDSHFTVLWDGGHIKFWSRRTLTTLLGEFGFAVDEFKGVGRFPFLWKSMFIKASFARSDAE